MKKKERLCLYFSLCLLIAYSVFQNYPGFKSFLKKGWLEKQPYVIFDKTVYDAISEYSRVALLTDLGNVTVRNLSREEEIVRNWPFYTSSPKNTFGKALIALGLLVDYEKSSDCKNFEALDRYATEIIDDSGNFRIELQTVDQCMIGYTLLGLYEIEKNEKLLNAINQIQTFLMDNHVKTAGGLIPYRKHIPQVLFIDTLGMVCPFLARFGYVFKSKESQQLAFRQLTDFYKNAIDATTGLPFHAYNETQKTGLGARGWTRGVGWHCIGLIDTIPYFPEHSKERNLLEIQFKSIIESIVKYQKENGCWSWEMCNIISTDDTSGSAMIAYAIARACEMGILADTYKSISEKALIGIIKYTTTNGKIMNSLAECKGIGNYPQIYGYTNWGQGSAQALCGLLGNQTQKGNVK